MSRLEDFAALIGMAASLACLFGIGRLTFWLAIG